MIQDNDDSYSVKYNFDKPIYVGSPEEREFVFDVWAYECERQHKELSEPSVIIRGESGDRIQDVHEPPSEIPRQSGEEQFSDMLFPCSEIWERYEYFSDPKGRFPFHFSRKVGDSQEDIAPEFPEFDVLSDFKTSQELEFDRLFGDLPTLPKKPHEMTEEERRLERVRYVGKVKKKIRRLVNRNHLHYMYTLTFALREDENVQGLRFTDMMNSDKQRNRDLVLSVWNTRLTVMRKTLQETRDTFRFLLVLEKHDSEKTSDEKRGTYHLHLATDEEINKHVLQRLWGYGVCWVDDFTKEKRWIEGEQKHVNEDGEFIRNPGEYMAKYLEKEIENPEFLCKKGYSRSRGNLVDPYEDGELRRQKDEIQQIMENPLPELDRQGTQLDPVQRERIDALTDIEQVKVFDSLEETGELRKVEITILHEEEEGIDDIDLCPSPAKTLTFYMRYRKYNFRKLHPKWKDPKPKPDLKHAPF